MYLAIEAERKKTKGIPNTYTYKHTQWLVVASPGLDRKGNIKTEKNPKRKKGRSDQNSHAKSTMMGVPNAISFSPQRYVLPSHQLYQTRDADTYICICKMGIYIYPS